MKKRSPRDPRRKANDANPKPNAKSAAGEKSAAAQLAKSASRAESSSRNNPCVTVAVGASAGGLEAFTELLKPLPKNPGMAFVLIPHLDPKHESAMTELLGRGSKMPVRQVFDGMKVQPDCVYVIPPNRSMSIQDSVLRLTVRKPEDRPPLPIDDFFRSLALTCGKNAIGVILSGTASDGTQGVAAIKNEGGITFAQEPLTAKYNSMPNNAIASGHIDFILPPADIARELMRIRRHPYVELDAAKIENGDEPRSHMAQIFQLLRQLRKVDFSEYKPATIRRRILRRMALNHVQDIADYVKMLQQNRLEIEALHHDILINVTSFFRDPEAFEVLQEIAYPEILKGRQPSETIRVWVPGCSTGEEAYSHAIALVEYISKNRLDLSVQVFGTDLSDAAVRTARSGIYKEHIVADVSPTRLRRFFSKTEGGYQISKAIRDMCVFATQNVFSDPPFSRMDLVSCRNVLIYLSQALQRRVIPIFHYALNPTGFLMVGNTEGLVGAGAELFEAADRKHKIYRKKMVPSQVAFGIPREHVEPRAHHASPAAMHEDSVRTPIDLHREADRLLLTKYVPAAVVVNEQLDILQIRGKVNRYLELPSGKATLNLLKMAKSGLLFELQRALEEAKETASTVRREDVQFENDGAFGTVNMEVVPFQAPLQQHTSFIIVFEEGRPLQKTETQRAVAVPPDAKDRQIGQLKQELAATKEYLQSIIEALEASNEELQSANEEIQSGNEELQSTNEELQTSKEELESANEELNTVNEEMQHRNMELSQLNNDLLNLLASVNIPIAMLDADLNIRRITPQAEDMLGILPSDLGRPLRHVRLKLNIPDLEREIVDVIQSLQPHDLQVPNGQNQGYRLRITPYRTMDNRIEGVVLVFLDSGAAHVQPDGQKSKRKNRGSRVEATAD